MLGVLGATSARSWARAVARGGGPGRCRGWGGCGGPRPRGLAAGAGGLEGLSVGQLQRLLDGAQVDYRDCLEKRELAKRLGDVRHALAPHLQHELDVMLAGGHKAAAQTERALGEALLPGERNAVALFERCAPSVVHIRTSNVVATPFSLSGSEVPAGSGTGILWDAQGHVVTNFHVIQKAQRARVTLADNRTLDCKLVGAEPDKDLAVLKVEAGARGGAGFRPLPVGSSSGLRVGQQVYAIGNPFGLDQTLTGGLVSGVGRDVKGVTGRTIRNVVQTDAAINPGNSGGPLLDSAGRLIGVNTMIYSPSGASAGIGFSVPADTVRRVVNQLIRHGKVLTPSLGISCAAEQQARQYGLEGVLVYSVVPGSGAAEAGLRGVQYDRQGNIVLGDHIIAVNGEAVTSAEDILAVIEDFQAGDAVSVSVKRGANLEKVSVHLQHRAE